MKKVFDKDGDLKVIFASDSKKQIQEWLGETNYDVAVKYAIEVNDPIFGKSLEFPCKIED